MGASTPASSCRGYAGKDLGSWAAWKDVCSWASILEGCLLMGFHPGRICARGLLSCWVVPLRHPKEAAPQARSCPTIRNHQLTSSLHFNELAQHLLISLSPSSISPQRAPGPGALAESSDAPAPSPRCQARRGASASPSQTASPFP